MCRGPRGEYLNNMGGKGSKERGAEEVEGERQAQIEQQQQQQQGGNGMSPNNPKGGEGLSVQIPTFHGDDNGNNMSPLKSHNSPTPTKGVTEVNGGGVFIPRSNSLTPRVPSSGLAPLKPLKEVAKRGNREGEEEVVLSVNVYKAPSVVEAKKDGGGEMERGKRKKEARGGGMSAIRALQQEEQKERGGEDEATTLASNLSPSSKGRDSKAFDSMDEALMAEILGNGDD